jgi:hypothetical protein
VREAVTFRRLVEMKFRHCVHHTQGAVSLPSLNKRARAATRTTSGGARSCVARARESGGGVVNARPRAPLFSATGAYARGRERECTRRHVLQRISWPT